MALGGCQAEKNARREGFRKRRVRLDLLSAVLILPFFGSGNYSFKTFRFYSDMNFQLLDALPPIHPVAGGLFLVHTFALCVLGLGAPPAHPISHKLLHLLGLCVWTILLYFLFQWRDNRWRLVFAALVGMMGSIGSTWIQSIMPVLFLSFSLKTCHL